MKQLYIYISLLFTLILPLFAGAQTAQSDLELYRSNMERAICMQRQASVRVQQLLTTPAEKYITDYLEGGFKAEGTSALLNLFYNQSSFDEQEAIIAKCYDMAAKHSDKGLKRLADLFKAWIVTHDNNPYERKMEMMEDVIRSCRKAGDRYMGTYVLDRMWKASFYEGHHARCFEYGARLAEALDTIGDDYPFKYWGYSGIGKAYFAYKDYDRSAYYLKKAITHDPNMSEDMTAMNTLAVYHHMNGDLDSAACYHRSIITKMDNPVHLQISICNLGKIYQERGDIDGAIILLRAGLENMKKDGVIYDFIYGVYTSLGECMLAKGDLPAVKGYIDKAKDGLLFPDITQTRRLKSIYALESKYYSRIGQQKMADSYLDSALVMAQKHSELVGQNVILLGEHRLKDSEIERNKEQIANQRHIILSILIFLSLILAGMALIVYLYRKKNAAYKALAIKAEEWANNSITPPVLQPCAEITKEDEQIMSLLEKEMQNFAYREVGLTTEILADRLGVHRNALSHAINCVTGGNFNAYINGFRIKEAVRIISQTSHKELYIDELYGQVGFGNRTSFYRSFKQLTGLSPIEFQKSKNSSLSEFNF